MATETGGESMNKNEIAERAVREIQSSCLGVDDEMGIVIFEAEKAKAIVERAIAESRSGPQCDCYAMFGQPHFHDCPAGLWRDVPAQYKENRWRFDHDERNSTFFVHSGGHRICDAEDSEVASAICNAFNISFSKKPEIAESQAKPDKCPSCGSRERDPRHALSTDSKRLYLCEDSWHDTDDITMDEATGITQGLEDMAKGRTKPIEQIMAELGDGEPSPPPDFRQFAVHLAHMIQNYRCLAEKVPSYERHGDEECVQAIAFLRKYESGILPSGAAQEVGEQFFKLADGSKVISVFRAAQEVSPPSLVRMKDGSLVHSNPCPKCGRTEIHKLCSDVPPRETDGHPVGWCCKHCYDGGYQAAMRLLAEEDSRGDTRELKAAANKLVDYCIAHDWGMMPEPYDSINPLLKLLGRFTERP